MTSAFILKKSCRQFFPTSVNSSMGALVVAEALVGAEVRAMLGTLVGAGLGAVVGDELGAVVGVLVGVEVAESVGVEVQRERCCRKIWKLMCNVASPVWGTFGIFLVW